MAEKVISGIPLQNYQVRVDFATTDEGVARRIHALVDEKVKEYSARHDVLSEFTVTLVLLIPDETEKKKKRRKD